MSGVLIAVVALAALVFLFVPVLMVGLAQSAARSEQVEKRSLWAWIRRTRKTDKAA
jgi:hypothetical protein